jgi:hypothetical protein
MTHWTASVVAILLASFPGVASARTDCEAIPRGPARTDFYLGLSQFYRAQSDLAAARARVQSDAAWYRAITVTDPLKAQTASFAIGDHSPLNGKWRGRPARCAGRKAK